MMEQLDLNGTWKVRWSDGQRGRADDSARETITPERYIDAVVPGEIHLDLVREGWISDPTVGTNVLAARWVEECYWHYRRDFEAPAEALRGRAWLVFRGLDLAAVIHLNGVEIARHGNAFYPCRIEVTGKLRPGHNWIAVQLESGIWSVADKPTEQWLHWPDQRLNKRHWLRKPQFQFGWDWAPRLINVGIFKSVTLEWTDSPARVDQLVPLVTVAPDLRSGSVRARLFIENLSPEPLAASLEIKIRDTGPAATQDVQLQPGLHAHEATLALDRPELWWPRGHGEQRLYSLHVRLTVKGTTIFEQTRQIGFRHVRVNQDPHPTAGRWFTIEINGRPIFCKGANWVPADMILAKIDRGRYEQLIDLAVEANFNFLRVWGGGLYESDEFYELCDRYGILVWQEFIFACSRYPTNDQAFFEDVQREARYNIRRLASHPSLVLWCGNNEIEWGDWDWDYGRVGQIMPDHGFFHVTLPRLLKEEDPTRHYHPSSPFSPDHLHPQVYEAGDQHPWGVGFFNNDFREYRKMTCRFPSEGGTLGPTSLPTMNKCLPNGQDRIGSLAWQLHDNAVATWTDPSIIDQMIQQCLGIDIASMTVEQFTYWAGLLQGEALREYCDNFRRRMFHDSAAAVFWMFNDCWPATRSWTIVDYYLRRTPAFWPVRRAMAPVHLVVAQDGEEVGLYVINDTNQQIHAELRYGLFNFAGGDNPLERQARVTAPPNASTRVATLPMNQWHDPRSSAAFGILRNGSDIIARNRLILPYFKELNWSPPQVHVEVLPHGRIRFLSPTFVWGVCLDLSGEKQAIDNFFDLLPGVPHEFPWPHPEPPRILHTGNLTAANK